MEMQIKISSKDAEKIIADEIRRRLGNLVSASQEIEVELPDRFSRSSGCTISVADADDTSRPDTPRPAPSADEAEARRAEAAREDAERMRRDHPPVEPI
jgi:hypothetical protein